MLAARALTSRFSRRFLREISAFPCVEEGRDETTIALCDPTETAGTAKPNLFCARRSKFGLPHSKI